MKAYDVLKEESALAEASIRLNRRKRQVFGVDDLSATDIAAIEATRAPEASRAFDDEVTQREQWF